ncbi:TolC family protein [Myxococcus stipitatus]|uniref:TolC family protein n=1 Tax=Myxococcus stipitatus TaxID=83455 RepID=UPI0030CFD941
MNALLLALLLSHLGPEPEVLLAQAGPRATARQRGSGTATPAARARGKPTIRKAQATQGSSDAGAKAQGQPAEGADGPTPTEPPTPEVSDPMLTPMPPAPIQMHTWDEALDLVRQRSTDLGTARAQVESAGGQARIALAGLLPSVNGTVLTQLNILDTNNTALFFGGGSGGGGGLTGGTTGFQTDNPLPGEANVPTPTKPPVAGLLTASVALFDYQAITTLRVAREAQHTATLSLAETRRQLSLSLARALVTVAAQERLADVNRVNLRSALERLALAQRRLELGAGTRLDVVRVQQDAETARALVVIGDEELRKARESLGLALGTPEAVGLAPGVSVESMMQRAKKDCHPLENLEGRSDLAAARSQVTVAERQIASVKAQYVPSISLSSTTVALTVKEDAVNVPFWNIGATLNLPFWDGGVREGLLRQSRAQATTARQQSLALERSATIEVVQARRGVKVAQHSRDISSREQKLAEENDRLTRRSFEVGTGTSLELIQTAAALRQAELALVVREFQLERAKVEAFLAEAACDW